MSRAFQGLRGDLLQPLFWNLGRPICLREDFFFSVFQDEGGWVWNWNCSAALWDHRWASSRMEPFIGSLGGA